MKTVFIGSENQAVIEAVRAAVSAADVQLSVADCAEPSDATDLLVLDAALSAAAAARLIAAARKSNGRQPAVFVSFNDTLAVRLAAVRAGAAGFFHLPIEASGFSEAIRELLRLPDEQPYRVLLIDDDTSLLALFGHHLKAAGFEVHALSDPAQGYQDAMRFGPDVMFLEISMPGIDGIELLSVLRQHPGFASTQMVLMSGEKSLTGQLEAMSHGAQSYLLKPVYPHDLVQAALNHAARARTVRNLLARDTLTGLFNHGRIHELAGREFARHKRTGSDFTVVALDLKHLKQINGSHSHQAGDAALKTVASHLQRTLRRSDCAGRTGGGEFLLLLPDTEKISAQTLVAKLRAVPLSIDWNGTTIPVEFSCGIADSHQRLHPGATVVAAENALAEAKRRGQPVAIDGPLERRTAEPSERRNSEPSNRRQE